MRKEITITSDTTIPIIDCTKNLGRAEFSLCTKYRYGKLTDIWLYPEQQEDTSYYYHIIAGGRTHFTLQGYHGIEHPRSWIFTYCKEHKCGSMRFYVPEGSKYLWISFLSSIGIGFLKKDIYL